MGWNLEVAAVRTDTLAGAVPDLFAGTGISVNFERAVSGDRGPDLCAAQVGEWVFVVDVGCRISAATRYLTKVSTATDLHVIRIAGAPLALHFHDGRLATEARGLAACLRLAPRMDGDGELCAMDLLALQTGVLFHQDLWDVSFTLFVQAIGRPSDRKASPPLVTTADS